LYLRMSALLIKCGEVQEVPLAAPRRTHRLIDLKARFTAGKAGFQEVETVADGIGPVFNNVSCVSCHSVPATGGGSTLVETRFGRMVNGQFDPMTDFGGSLIQTQGIGLFNGVNFVGETVPPQATIVAGRRTTPLFGLGLVNAVPEE
jgi:hypothetical protein